MVVVVHHLPTLTPNRLTQTLACLDCLELTQVSHSRKQMRLPDLEEVFLGLVVLRVDHMLNQNHSMLVSIF